MRIRIYIIYTIHIIFFLLFYILIFEKYITNDEYMYAVNTVHKLCLF